MPTKRCELCGTKNYRGPLREVMINSKAYLACEQCWSEHTTDPTAEEAYDRWAQTEAQHEADELQAEAAMEQEFADMMALALTDDLPDDLQDICDYFI